MEYTQWDEKYGDIEVVIQSLNPCCNGIYSMSAIKQSYDDFVVLILVVMEYTQWVIIDI